MPRRARKSACCRLPVCWPKRFYVSATRTPCPRCSSSKRGTLRFLTTARDLVADPRNWSCIMQIEVKAQVRKAQGTGASRRLRRAGKTPGILYGGDEPSVAIELDHNELFQHLRKEAFHASILSLNVEGKKQPVLLRTYTMHPFRREVQHIDFQRVAADQKVRMEVPLHFMNQENNDAVKLGGAKITHVLTELEVRCLPSALPEYIEVDLTHIPVNG